MVLNEHGSFSPYLIHYKMHMIRSKYNSVQCTGIPLWPLWLEDRVCCFFCFYLITHTFTKCMCQLTQWSIFFLNAFLSISVPQIHLSVVKMLLLSMMTHLLKMWNTKKRTGKTLISHVSLPPIPRTYPLETSQQNTGGKIFLRRTFNWLM